jgi:hypothetical protein
MDEEDIPRDYGWCRSRREISCGAAFPSLTIFFGYPQPQSGLGKKPEIPKQENQLSFLTATLAGIHGPDWGMQ